MSKQTTNWIEQTKFHFIIKLETRKRKSREKFDIFKTKIIQTLIGKVLVIIRTIKIPLVGISNERRALIPTNSGYKISVRWLWKFHETYVDLHKMLIESAFYVFKKERKRGLRDARLANGFSERNYPPKLTRGDFNFWIEAICHCERRMARNNELQKSVPVPIKI